MLKPINDINNQCKNIAGLTDISLLPSILKNAEFLIGLESGNVHIAESVNCRAICLSNGAYYKRFHPYPDNKLITYIYPNEFDNYLKESNDDRLSKFYDPNFEYNMNDIPSQKVIKVIDKYLQGVS